MAKLLLEVKTKEITEEGSIFETKLFEDLDEDQFQYATHVWLSYLKQSGVQFEQISDMVEDIWLRDKQLEITVSEGE